MTTNGARISITTLGIKARNIKKGLGQIAEIKKTTIIITKADAMSKVPAEEDLALENAGIGKMIDETTAITNQVLTVLIVITKAADMIASKVVVAVTEITGMIPLKTVDIEIIIKGVTVVTIINNRGTPNQPKNIITTHKGKSNEFIFLGTTVD